MSRPAKLTSEQPHAIREGDRKCVQDVDFGVGFFFEERCGESVVSEGEVKGGATLSIAMC